MLSFLSILDAPLALLSLLAIGYLFVTSVIPHNRKD